MADRWQGAVPSSAVELSIIVPVFNESGSIDAFFDRLEGVLRGLPIRSYEIMCINDGSKDDTLAELLRNRSRNPAIKIIDLSRNFGKEHALTCGLHLARGQAVVPMDVDLQDPPELLEEFIAKWREGYEVVYGIRTDRREESFVKRTTAHWFYRIFQRLADVDVPVDTGDFRLMDRKVVDAVNRLPEHNRFMKGMFAWVGFSQVGVPYQRPQRAHGHSKLKFWRLWNLALEGITSYSTVPLRIWSYVGGAIALMAFIYALALVVQTIIGGVDVPGYASLMVAVLFMGGLQLMIFGIMGEYLGRMYYETKRRPSYIIRQAWGVSDAG